MGKFTITCVFDGDENQLLELLVGLGLDELDVEVED